MGYIDIVFDGPPSHESGRFVEVENDKGCSISFGRWLQREDGYWAIRFDAPPSWQPIASAPKDGTVIMVCGGTFTTDESMFGPDKLTGVSIASWRDNSWEGDPDPDGYQRYDRHSPEWWMPMPEPKAPQYAETSCSNCGQSFGPGDSGFSHCDQHDHLKGKP